MEKMTGALERYLSPEARGPEDLALAVMTEFRTNWTAFADDFAVRFWEPWERLQALVAEAVRVGVEADRKKREGMAP